MDHNRNGEISEPLEKVADIKTAREKIQQAFKDSQASARDADRMDIIDKILKEFLP